MIGFISLSVHYRTPQITKVESEELESTSDTATIDTAQSNFEISEKVDYTAESITLNEDADSSDQNFEHLRSIMRRDADSISVTKNSDGSSTAFLNGTFKTVSAAKLLPDGTLVTRCFENFDALEKFITSTTEKSK